MGGCHSLRHGFSMLDAIISIGYRFRPPIFCNVGSIKFINVTSDASSAA